MNATSPKSGTKSQSRATTNHATGGATLDHDGAAPETGDPFQLRPEWWGKTRTDPSKWSDARKQIESELPAEYRTRPGMHLIYALAAAQGITEAEMLRRLKGEGESQARMEAHAEIRAEYERAQLLQEEYDGKKVEQE
jgi:hypothetical protein